MFGQFENPGRLSSRVDPWDLLSRRPIDVSKNPGVQWLCVLFKEREPLKGNWLLIERLCLLPTRKYAPFQQRLRIEGLDT